METREAITLDSRAQRRLYVLNHVLAGEITAGQAAAFLRRSTRQLRRLLAAYRAEGAAALCHGNAGRQPANRVGDDRRRRLVELATTTYAGTNRAHLADLLAEREDLAVPARTLRRILAEAGVAAVRRRRPARHRSRRERMSQAGLLVQVDGSRHDWLEGRGPWLTLVGGIDDATGIVTGGVFREQEDAIGYFTVLSQTADRFGLPVGLYSDRSGIFWKGRTIPTLAEQFAGRPPTTQFGRALEAAGIAWIAAHSPQAKGRVEPLWGTLQDRLRVELRLAGATTLGEANDVLAAYLPRHNAWFAVPAADPGLAWRPLPDDRPAAAVFCFRHARRLAADGTFTLNGHSLMVAGRSGDRPAGRSVTVQERLDGSLWIDADGTFHPVVPAPERPAVLRTLAEPASAPRSSAHPARPDHPWRRYPAVRPR